MSRKNLETGTILSPFLYYFLNAINGRNITGKNISPKVYPNPFSYNEASLHTKMKLHIIVIICPMKGMNIANTQYVGISTI